MNFDTMEMATNTVGEAMLKLEQEYDFYKKNKPILIEEYKGQFIIIKGQKVHDSYPSREEALEKALHFHRYSAIDATISCGNVRTSP